MTKKDYAIQTTFWGVRGSIPTPGKEFMKYGGNTPCVEVRCGNTILLFDAGTGIRGFADSLRKEFGESPPDLHILISHTHWDHIQGFPFFEYAYMKGVRINLYGGNSTSDFDKLILDQMRREYFPVTLYELSSDLRFRTLEDNPFHIQDVEIYYTHLIHPAMSLGFRVEYRGKVFVYATDNEILCEPEMQGYNERNIGYLIRNADILVAECQYTESEYRGKIGWGHSSIDQVIKISNTYGVKNLFCFHHDPRRTDKEIDTMIRRGRKLAKSPLRVFGAKEKMTFCV